MYLKSLKMKGFKSFPEKTELEFAPGVSVVVGPNGSGKSNITDAVLWALGEQSPAVIRGSSMQDMISLGGSSTGARQAAEVEVVIDNSDRGAGDDFSEISVTRRLDRNGDGEYRLNGARCRLVDVIEVLSDANLGKEMHSVISQGQVESIVNSRPRERRLLIEEAAGLGKFRRRRRRSELKLKATRDNLDRALDVEREARRALRPLKQQANAAEIGARIEREELGLKALILAEDLRFGEAKLEQARKEADEARGQRDQLDERLARVSARRSAAEEKFARRDRERTEMWATLNSLRAAREKIHFGGVSMTQVGRSLEPRIEKMKLELAPLTLDLDGVSEGADRASRLVEELKEVAGGLERARGGLDRAGSEVPETQRLGGLAEVHAGAGHAIDHARRAESLLGERHRERLGARLGRLEALSGVMTDLVGAGTAVSEAIAVRIAKSEAGVVGDGEDADEIAKELKACSDEEIEIQAGLRAIAEKVTTSEVEAAHLEDRRAEAVGELERIATRTGDPTPEPDEQMSDEERATTERRIESLRTRREKLGPVNPLARREYEEAQEHLSALVEQREDTERALRELEGMIRDIDAEITRSFDQTFEATAANFEEMIAKLFPGGGGRLRKVDLTPAPVSDGEAEEGGDSDADDPDDPDDEGREFGVELEVTPKGKRTRQMKLLSGGEKALTALAFVFAVFLARPCPFYILDEVEAALDDANISRFLDLVAEFSDRTQFIIVTHQKLTMDAADVLYGVSMGGDGVTKVVSRRLPRDTQNESGDSRLTEAA